MTHYIETQTGEGSSVRIEVEDTSKPATGFAHQSTSTNVSGDNAEEAYQQVLQTIRGCADGIIGTIQDLQTQPDTVAVDFAIKVDAEAGAMVAKTREDAQFRVSLSWKQSEPEKDEKDEKE